jgi:glutamate--cysteine ligase
MTWLTEQSAERHVAEHSFDTGPIGFVGATVEMLPVALLPVDAPAGPVLARLGHGYLAGDYAGVLAVSTPPSPGLDVAVRRVGADLAAARALLARHGFAPSERAVATHRTGTPADDAAVGVPGTATAAVRVCLDAGAEGADLRRRWAVAQAVAPVLAAAFANSPLRDGRRSGWRSTRQGLRLAIDTPLPPGDPRTSWTRYALDRPLSGAGISFRQSLRDGRTLDAADLRRHLDALPAPVRARGHLELSMIDAQPGEGWRVALAVTTALIDDPRAADKALAATADLPTDTWTRAARDALSDPLLADAARRCFVAAYAALARQGADRGLRDAVATYIQRYVSRARTPADDVLDSLRTPT